MFSESDEKYLIRLLGKNKVVLFLGSGFSMIATNRNKENFPTGWVLSQKIWKFLDFPGDYDGSSLQELFQSFIHNKKKSLSEKNDFLNNNLLSDSIPEIYDAITIPYWYKIYTLNIDDIIDKTYKRNNKSIQTLKFPHDEFKERDQSLEKTQCVYLHGKLPCNPEDVIFSTKQYARATLKHQPLYSQFTFDYATTATIFIGTDLNEILFESYIESREGKDGHGELRPKSFIITPKLSPVKKENFKNIYNVHHIEGTTEDFLNWLKKIESELPTKDEVLKGTFPNLLQVNRFARLAHVSTSTVGEFASSFEIIPKDYIIKKERSGYLTGANPNWNDIFSDLDIPRTITNKTFDLINDSITRFKETDKQRMFTILGSAGSGKSTILKRLGLRLSQNGRTVFICNSDYIPKTEKIAEILSAIDEQVILIFDNAKNILKEIPYLTSAFSKVRKPPIIILGLRMTYRHKLEFYLDPDLIDNTDIQIPNLDDEEINNLISKLEDNNLLGQLKGLSSERRFAEFKYKAKKQILVAMKETTKGKSFDEIIQDEFNEIEPYEAKLLCVCISLNTEQGFFNSVQDFVGFANVSYNEALNILKFNLNGIIVWNDLNTQFMIRHKILADFIIKNCSDLDILKEAYIRVLNVLAPELKKSLGGHIRKFNLYKALINHQNLYARFKEDINLARDVYDSVMESFNNDAHFWLQYGSLEMTGTGGNLEFAENYISQAESLAPESNIIQNSKCNLYYKLSVSTSNFSMAFEYKKMADELSNELINRNDDPYIHHIHCLGNYLYVRKWVKSNEEKKEKYTELKKKINKAVSQYPRNRDIEFAHTLINRAYLHLGTNIEED